MAKCFITGGAGFIGSHLVDRLLDKGDLVTVYDNLSSGRREWIEHNFGRRGFQFVEADLLEPTRLVEAMRGHDLVWHLGANTDIAGGNQRRDLDLNNCTIATYNVLEALRANSIGRLVFASTSAVYGDSLVMPTTEGDGPYLPISLYGAAKLACETLISAYCHLFDIQAWMFRFANVVGGRMGRGVIYDFIQKLKRNPRELEILGDGEQEKPYFLVDDCLEGMFCAVGRSNGWCDVFNLGCSTTTKAQKISRIVVEEMGLEDVRFKHTGGRRGWPGDVPQLRLDVSRMKTLGWEVKRHSDEAVRIAARRLLGKESRSPHAVVFRHRGGWETP